MATEAGANALARFCSVCKADYGPDVRFCPVDGGAIVERDESQDPLIGRTLAGRYLIRGRLGQGGMGVVYKADHIGLDKPVAIKFLLDKYTEDREVLTRFHREARTSSRIGHENIIDITDIGETEDGRNYIVMEYLEGADLAEVLESSGPMPAARAADIITQVLHGLAAAHEKNIIHRDMKPENVFIIQRDGRDFVKIMDFGISKIIDAHDSKVRLTETGAVIGTPIYMAPEQAKALPTMDHRVDIYAVGVMLYEMLGGRPPFVAPTYLALVTQLLYDPPPPLRELRKDCPEVLANAAHRALAKEPADRFSTALQFAGSIPSPEAFHHAAKDVLSTLPDDAHSSGRAFRGAYAAPTAREPRPVRRRSKTPYIIVGTATVIAAAAIGFALLSNSSDKPSDPAQPAAAAPVAPADAAPATRAVVKPLLTVAEVESKPKGAKVYIDGVFRGHTPLRLDDIGAGAHHLRIEKDGFEAFETRTKLRQGITERIFAALSKSSRRSSSKRKRPVRNKVEATTKKTKPSSTRNPYETGPRKKPADHKKNPYE